MQMYNPALARTKTPITYFHISLRPGALHLLPLPEEQKACLYLFQGNLSGEGPETSHHEGDLLELGAGEYVRIQAGDSGCELLVLAATPIGEPVVRYGPFVMNSEREIREAITDYQAGRLG